MGQNARTQADATRGKLEPGVVVRGRVTTIKDYGAFVDIGGLEGMLHVSQLGFQRVAHPKDVLTVGQEIEVQVLKIEKSDDPKRPEKISLSLKSLERDPWADVAQRFPEGARVAGQVRRTEPFGAFVELAPGIEGLVHVSELGAKRQVRHAKDVVKAGQAVQVTVLSVDTNARRISLSLAVEDDGGDTGGGGAPTPSGAAPTLGTFADLLKKKK
jgi:small subunit ribosomal protein S1